MKLIKSLSAYVVTCFTGTWWLMLALGVAHFHLMNGVQAAGYWQVLPFTALIALFIDGASFRAFYDWRTLENRS